MKRILSKKKDKKEANEHKKPPIFVDVNGSMGMSRTERDILDIHFPRLQKTLNAKNVLKHLRRNGQVGNKEEEFILQKKGGKSSKEDQVLMLMDYLKRREDGFTILVTALVQSKSQDHLAKELLRDSAFTTQEVSEQLAKVEKRLDESQKGKLQKFREEALTHQGPPLKPERSDSLLTDSESEYSVSLSSFPGGSLHHDDSGFVNSNEMFEDKPVFENTLESGERDNRLLENILHTLSTKAHTDESIPSGWTELYSTESEQNIYKAKATSAVEDKEIESHEQEAMITARTAEDEIPNSIKQEKETAENVSFENGGPGKTDANQQDEHEKEVLFLECRVRHSSLQNFPADFYGTEPAAIQTNEEPEDKEVTSDVDVTGNAPEVTHQSDAIFYRRNTFPKIKSVETTRERRGIADDKVRSVLESIKELRESTQHLQEKLQGEHRRLHQMRYNTHRLLGVMH